MKRSLLFIMASMCYINFAFAQNDTLKLSLQEVEARFLKNNISLLIAKTGIEESKAYEYQAKLLPNPNLYFETMPYNNQRRAFLPIKQSNAEQIVQFQQLVRLAHKRQKQVALAQSNTEQLNNNFYELLRNILFSLRSAYYNLNYAQKAVSFYDEEINTLQRIVDLYQVQYEKGNVPLKDLARMKAYLVTLNAEKQEIIKQIIDNQIDLNLLMANKETTIIKPYIEGTASNDVASALKLSELYNVAFENRFDYKMSLTQLKIEQQNLLLQEAQKVPDLNLQLTYDRNGSYTPNYIGFGVGMALPFFNKNQGNIQAAKVRIQSSELASQNQALILEKDVERAYFKAVQAEKNVKTFDTKFTKDFSSLMQGVITNYQKQNIDVVEFLDFFDSYKTTLIQENQFRSDQRQAYEQLNWAVGKAIL